MVKTKCEVYSRVVGYLRPVQQWNEGKAEEFEDRETFEKSSNDKDFSEIKGEASESEIVEQTKSVSAGEQGEAKAAATKIAA